MKSLKFTGSLHPDNDTLTDMMKILILAMIILKCTLFRFSCYNSCQMAWAWRSTLLKEICV